MDSGQGNEKKKFSLFGIDFTSDECILKSLGVGIGGAFAVGCAYHLVR